MLTIHQSRWKDGCPAKWKVSADQEARLLHRACMKHPAFKKLAFVRSMIWSGTIKSPLKGGVQVGDQPAGRLYERGEHERADFLPQASDSRECNDCLHSNVLQRRKGGMISGVLEPEDRGNLPHSFEQVPAPDRHQDSPTTIPCLSEGKKLTLSAAMLARAGTLEGGMLCDEE